MQNLQRPLEVVPPPRRPTDVRVSEAGLVTCSICLKVQGASGWIPAEDVILELRTWERRQPIQLRPGICDDCSTEIEERRGYARVAQQLHDAA
jgi:hypothetical protein